MEFIFNYPIQIGGVTHMQTVMTHQMKLTVILLSKTLIMTSRF